MAGDQLRFADASGGIQQHDFAGCAGFAEEERIQAGDLEEAESDDGV